MANNISKNTKHGMSITEILHYFGHYFELEEIQNWVTNNVAEKYSSHFIRFRYGFFEIDQIDNPREQKMAEEISTIKKLIENNPLEELKKRYDEIERTLIRCSNLDTYETYRDFEEMCKFFSDSKNPVRVSDLLLYCAFRSQTNLYTFTRATEVYAGRKNRTLSGEIEVYDGKGDILLSTDGNDFIRRSHQVFPEYIEPLNRKKFCSDSIKKIFKAQKELKKLVKKSNLKSLRIKIKASKHEKYETEGRVYRITDLDEALKTRTVWQNIDYTHIDEWIEEGLVTREEITKAFREGKILPKDLAILNELGIIPKITEATKDNTEVQNNRLYAKLALYSQDKESIESIEAFLLKAPEQRDSITDEMLEELMWSFTNVDIRHSLYSLMIHDVLDYDQSMVLIGKFKYAERLKKEDEEFLKKGIHDFKVNQLKNLKQIEAFDIFEKSGISSNTKGRLTIDPLLRAKYFKDIGGVKSIFIDGSRFIKDEDDGRKHNSLDGYQLLIIPDKGVAVLEKFFETTHKDGEVVYKRDKNGDLIPAIENATYVLPIEKAVEYATRKNKKDLRKIKKGRATVYHTKNWVINIEAAMEEIAPQYAKFSPDKTQEWAATIKDDYEKRIKE